MISKLTKGISEVFQETGRMAGTIGGKLPLPAVVPNLEGWWSPIACRSAALILADRLLNRLGGYARKRSRARNDYYQRDLNWIADVLLRIEAGERNPLRPTGE